MTTSVVVVVVVVGFEMRAGMFGGLVVAVYGRAPFRYPHNMDAYICAAVQSDAGGISSWILEIPDWARQPSIRPVICMEALME